MAGHSRIRVIRSGSGRLFHVADRMNTQRRGAVKALWQNYFRSCPKAPATIGCPPDATFLSPLPESDSRGNIPSPRGQQKTPPPHALARENGVNREPRVTTSIPLPPLMFHLPPIPPPTGNRLRSTGPPQRIPPPPRHQISPLGLPSLRNQHALPMPCQHILAHRHLLPIARLDLARQRYPRDRRRDY